MIKAKGPVWHQKDRKKGIIPKGLRGVDKQATWGKSKADGWVHGHGTFSITPHNIPIVGIFQWMSNSGNDAKRMEKEIVKYESIIKTVCMDSKADDQKMYWNLKKEHGIQLVTSPRKYRNPSIERKQYINNMLTKKNRKIYKNRSITVEPMQGLMADIFELDKCWMRGIVNNRWLFAAMGIAVQMAQLQAHKNKQSTWNIKSMVLGI